MFDEMSFLFSVDPSLRNRYNNQSRNVNNQNPIESVDFRTEIDEDDSTKINTNTYVINRDGVRNYIQSNVNRAYRNEKMNPYLELIKFTNEPETAKSLKLKSSDFAYLRDIGVMPINRLMILRRFPEGTIVPVDLNELNAEPISVVIGWVKADSNLLDFSFSEKWSPHTTMLHTQINEIMTKQFGFNTDNVVPIPGWGVGFLFQVLYEMDLTSYNMDRLPLGDPNLLQESLIRPPDEFGLNSSFKFEFETVYEQKYIAGIDPTVSTYEIINNLLTMGTSNTRFFGKKGSEQLEKLKKANESYNDSNAWVEFASSILLGFVKAIGKAVEIVSSDLGGILGLDNKEKAEEKAEEKESTEDTETTSVNTAKEFLENISDSKTARTLIASTLGRYQWPLRGSISMLTGDPTTPWHLTVGNPYAPLLSMNNIHVSDVDIKGGNELGHNDLPKILQVKITMKEGRNLGKQEIFDMFGVRYKRDYFKKIENNNN